MEILATRALKEHGKARSFCHHFTGINLLHPTNRSSIKITGDNEP